MKLFPAATVTIEPNAPWREGWGSGKWVRFQYLTTSGDPTPWLKDLWARPAQRQGGSVFRKDKLPANRLQRVYVPADVTLKLRIDRLDERSAPVVIEGVRLVQGQVMELGRVDFPPALQVAVRVVDSAGKPLEGINVLCQDKRGRGAVTNGDGIAHLFVVPNSEGYFIVECWDKETRRLVWEGAPYRVAGPQDAGREFVLPLSDAFLEQLLDSQASR